MSPFETDPLPEVDSRRALAAAEVVWWPGPCADLKRPLHVACLDIQCVKFAIFPQALSVTA